MDHTRQGGFTLIEIVVLLAVISILAGALAPLMAQKVDQARTEATETRLERLAEALREYHLDVTDFPADTGNAAADLGQLAANGAGASGWDGPYITQNSFATDYALDGWDMPLQYRHTPGTATATLTSAGRDHTFASADDIIKTVAFDLRSVTHRVTGTRERLKLIAGDLYGANPTAAPASYTIPPQWATDPWGNPFRYTYTDARNATLTGNGPDGAPDTGDDIPYPLSWN